MSISITDIVGSIRLCFLLWSSSNWKIFIVSSSDVVPVPFAGETKGSV